MKFCGVFVLLCVACATQTPSQVIVSIDADPTVQARARWIRLRVIDSDGNESFRETSPLQGTAAVAWPVSPPPLAALDGDASRRFTIESELFDTDAEPTDEAAFNSLSARSSFEAGAVTYLSLSHRESCDDIAACGPGQTCQNGRCVGSCVVPTVDEGAPVQAQCSECQVCGEQASCEGIDDGSDCTCGACRAGVCEAGGVIQGISLGDAHTCARTGMRSLFCWGSNTAGQLARTGEGGPTPMISVSGSFTDSAGEEFTCSIDAESRRTRCWGSNGSKRLGVDDFRPRSEPVEIASTAQFQAIAVGTRFGCALDGDGEVICWGSCIHGQLGPTVGGGDSCGEMGTALPLIVPLPGVSPAQVSAGNGHVCIRSDDNAVYCWGDNRDGQAGDLSGPSMLPEPYRVSFPDAGDSFIDVSCGGFYTCAVAADNSLWCWGGSSRGNLGIGTSMERRVGRLREANDFRAVDVECGRSHCCAIEEGTRELWCWGSNDMRQVGAADPADIVWEPVLVAPGFRWQTLALGWAHSCAVEESGMELWCWGNNALGQVGPDLGEVVPQPRRVCLPQD